MARVSQRVITLFLYTRKCCNSYPAELCRRIVGRWPVRSIAQTASQRTCFYRLREVTNSSWNFTAFGLDILTLTVSTRLADQSYPLILPSFTVSTVLVTIHIGFLRTERTKTKGTTRRIGLKAEINTAGGVLFSQPAWQKSILSQSTICSHSKS